MAHIIRTSYPAIRANLCCPYVGGEEVRNALLLIGTDVSEVDPKDISEVLGWKEMGLPVAMIEGQPRYYFPAADPIRKGEFSNVTEQVALCAHELRGWKIPAARY